MSTQNDIDDELSSDCEEAIAAYLLAEEKGCPPSREALLKRHPQCAAELDDFLQHHQQITRLSTWWHNAIGEPAPSSRTIGATPSRTAAAQPAPQLPGYEILHEIARGGMGVIYKARQTSLSRVVAVKMILQGQLASGRDRRRFMLEAAAAAKLKHPHIVVIHEVGEHAGEPFFTMEYIEGESLSSVLRRGRPADKVAARYVQQAAQAVQFAHDHGVLHRDIKPSNILIDASGAARVTDFGLAKNVADNQSDGAGDQLTVTGQLLGTPAYMAPEQIRGPHSAVGAACDVYGLGAVLYELITGEPPFRGATNVETLIDVLDAEPQLPRRINADVPRELETIAMKCLEKDPANRYPTAQAVVDDIQRYLEGDSISASSPNLIGRVVRTLERSQYDREFHAWSTMLAWIAGIALVTHLLVFANHVLNLSDSLTAQIAIRAFELVGMLGVLWAARRDWYPPRGAPARQLWAVWSGYMVGSQTLLAATYLMTPDGAVFDELRTYPSMAVLASLAYIVLGSSYWGYCYVIGGAFVGLALLMPFWLAVAPLAFAVSWAASLATLAARLQRFRADGDAG